ncbi:hypothetical protein HK096_004916 [Nowakowskiella sp. JEL0078]|nr:hypothetical protein HK096_004916 [Nowakowskiella sp. JEL0078]
MASSTTANEEKHDNSMVIDQTEFPDDVNNVPVTFAKSRKRFIPVVFIFLLTLLSSVIWVTFAPIPSASATYFQTSFTTINWLSNTYMLMYIPGGILSSIILDSRGSHEALWIGSILTTLGALLRYVGCFIPNPSGALAFMYIGQIIAGFAQPFLLNAPTKVTAEWFLAPERSLYNALMTVGSLIGSLVAYVIAPAVVTTPTDIPTFLLIITIACAVVTILALVLSTRPPKIIHKPKDNSKPNYFGDFLTVLKISFHLPHYWLLAFAASIAIGLYNAFGTLLNQLVLPFGYTDDDSSILGGIFIIGGVISAAVCGAIVDRSQKHVLFLKVMFPIAAIAFTALAIVAPISQILPALCVVIALTGIFTVGMQPAAFELAASICRFDGREVTKSIIDSKDTSDEMKRSLANLEINGIGEGFASGFIWMAAQVTGVIFVGVFDQINSRLSTKANGYMGVRISLWCIAGLAIFGAICIFTYPKSRQTKRESVEDLSLNTVN